MRLMKVLLFLLLALRAEAAMVRVVSIEDGRTLTVERDGSRERIQLAGVEVLDHGAARELLRWTAGTWVMIEPAPGGYLLYRSGDALLLNRELVLRGYARATLPTLAPPRAPARYLGEIDPYGPPPKATPRVSEDSPRRTRSGTSRRSSAPRSRRARSPGRR